MRLRLNLLSFEERDADRLRGELRKAAIPIIEDFLPHGFTIEVPEGFPTGDLTTHIVVHYDCCVRATTL